MSFGELETIVRSERSDWKAALQQVSGIYVIADEDSDRPYGGAAYGKSGVWSRWSEYVNSGHGGNVELREVIGSAGLDYCRRNSRFALVETLLPSLPDEAVATREAYWKNVLRTRGRRGLNQN